MRFSRRFEWSTPGWGEAERWERMIQNILLRSAAELRRRQQSVDLFENVVSWARPALGAAFGVVGLSLLIITEVDYVPAETSFAQFSVAEPFSLEEWLQDRDSPLWSELYFFISGKE